MKKPNSTEKTCNFKFAFVLALNIFLKYKLRDPVENGPFWAVSDSVQIRILR
jgi:hypothetical protein